jgi:hypothetical protein
MMRADTSCRPCRWLGVLGLLCGLVSPAYAQSVQTGHYAPGWNSGLRAGVMPEAPGWYFLNTTMYFNAQRFRDGSGDVVSRDETDYLLTALAISWRPDFQLLGGDYMAVVTPAVGNLSGVPILVDGEPNDPGVGLTDIYFAPLTLGWHLQDLDVVAALGGFAPTGDYDKDDPTDNTGLGFWTFIPHVAASYRLDRGLFESAPFLGMGAVRYEIHSNQQGRDFRPGDTLTLEGGVGLELGSRTEAGIMGFHYRQTTNPNGSDAEPVDKYRSSGIGLHLAHTIGSVALSGRVYRDFDVRNGPQGTLAYLEIGFGLPRDRKD